MKKTKIVATLGAPSGTEEKIEALIHAGVDIFRLNFSHDTQEAHAARIQKIRKVAKECDRAIAILGDLQGPKIRTGLLKGHNPIELIDNQKIVISINDIEGAPERISTPYKQLIHDVIQNDRILINDGIIELRVEKVIGHDVVCTVIHGGELGERKGINIPGKKISVESLTEKDKSDLAFCLDNNIDYIALSFVRDAADLITLKQIIQQSAKNIPVIAKIETPLAVQNIDQIILECDGIMVARGDLGVEMPLENIPVIQKELIEKAVLRHKLVITATQMLESMTYAARPTRAEVTDVANAIFDGTDAVMLSGETAIGHFPIETVKMMKSIAIEADNSKFVRNYSNQRDTDKANLELATTTAAFAAYEEAEAKAFLVFTMTGNTSRYLSKLNPLIPILAITPEIQTYQRMALQRHVIPILTGWAKNRTPSVQEGVDVLLERKLVKPGETIIVLIGDNPEAGATNVMKIMKV